MKNLKIMGGSLLLAMLITLNVTAQSSPKGKAINTILNNYLTLKDALATGNGDDAEQKLRYCWSP